MRILPGIELRKLDGRISVGVVDPKKKERKHVLARMKGKMERSQTWWSKANDPVEKGNEWMLVRL
jgi:ABC-type uncharacterized transport system ATPase subunit